MRGHATSLPASVLGASAASMALEIAAARLIAPYVGMSLYSWTAIIAVVLAGLALGHWVGGRLADGPGARRALAWSLALAAALSFASPFVLRLTALPVLASSAPVPGTVILTTPAFLLPSLAAGTVAPLATALALEGAAEKGRVLGRMFALGAGGAILGTLAGGLLLVPELGAARTAAACAVAYALLAAWVAGGAARIGALALAAGAAVTTAAFGAAWSPCERESGHFCLRTDEVAPGVRVLALDHLAHGVNDRDDPQRLASPYVAAIDALVAARLPDGPKAAFFLGGGAYTLPRAWAERWPGARLVVAEIDPAVTRLAEERLWLDAGGMTVIHRDARAALREAAGPFDAVVGDAFADVSIPAHLVTSEFAHEVAAKLAPGGAYAINVVDLKRAPRFATSMAATLAEAFGVVEMWIAEAALTPGEARTTWVLLASDAPSPSARIEAQGGAWVRVDAARMRATVPGHRVLTDERAPVARLLGRLLLDPALAE